MARVGWEHPLPDHLAVADGTLLLLRPPRSVVVHPGPVPVPAPDEFRLPPPLWARVVSDFAVAYHERRLSRDHLLRALTPLYLGRVAAFIAEARATRLEKIPAIFETIDRAFEAEKEHLVARWR